MTALRKFLPCDHDADFHRERFGAFLIFIDALSAPLPEFFNNPFLISKSLREYRSKTVVPSVAAERDQ